MFTSLLKVQLKKSKFVITSYSIHYTKLYDTCTSMALLNKGELAYTGSPDDIVSQANGKVWLIKATESEYMEINEKYPVISTVPTPEGWEIQVVADQINGYYGHNIDPNLEHRNNFV